MCYNRYLIFFTSLKNITNKEFARFVDISENEGLNFSENTDTVFVDFSNSKKSKEFSFSGRASQFIQLQIIKIATKFLKVKHLSLIHI